MESVLSFITGKQFTAILYALTLLWGIRQGFLNQLKPYVRSLPYAVYLKILLTAIALAGVLFFFDQLLIDKVQNIQATWMISLIDFGSLLGKSALVWGYFSLVYWAATVFRQDRLKIIAFACLVSSGLVSLFVHIIKYIFVRARPLMELGPHRFFDYQGFGDYGSRFLSFPSGDVAISAGVTGLLFFAMKSPVRFIFPVIALLTCLSRMSLDKHWPSDVMFSFVISFAFAKFVWGYVVFRKGTGPFAA